MVGGVPGQYLGSNSAGGWVPSLGLTNSKHGGGRMRLPTFRATPDHVEESPRRRAAVRRVSYLFLRSQDIDVCFSKFLPGRQAPAHASHHARG